MNIVSIAKDFNEANSITHGGIFHADEVFSTAILSLFMNVNLARVFKIPDEVDDDVIVYDIGHGKFDHHQKGGNGERFNGVPYSSAGLIWKEYGMKVLKGVPNAKEVYKIVDISLIQPIDAHDNGYAKFESIGIQEMNISKMIAFFNPTWDSIITADEAFVEAVEMAEKILTKVIDSAIATAKARKIIDGYIEESENGIMVMKKFIPWQEAFFSSKNSKANEILVVVFPSSRGGFNWQCVPTKMNGYDQKKTCPIEWRGLRNEELVKISGVENATFCHNAGFIGGANTFEDTIKMARIIIDRK